MTTESPRHGADASWSPTCEYRRAGFGAGWSGAKLLMSALALRARRGAASGHRGELSPANPLVLRRTDLVFQEVISAPAPIALSHRRGRPPVDLWKIRRVARRVHRNRSSNIRIRPEPNWDCVTDVAGQNCHPGSRLLSRTAERPSRRRFRSRDWTLQLFGRFVIRDVPHRLPIRSPVAQR